MSNNFIQQKVWYVVFVLLFINSIDAKVNPQPGENLWRLAARIGDCVDVADSKLDVLDSQNDLICSKIEKIDDDLATHNDIVCSKLEILGSVVDELDIDIDTDSICSKLENFDEDLSMHDALICSKLGQVNEKQDLLLSAVDEIEAISACEALIFQSDIPFTIDSPGVYCLAESVSFATGTAITIASGNVLLDLQDKKIDGSLGGDIGIAINSGLSNITIQNGLLCNMNNKGIDADATNNIAFISMSVNDSLIDMPVCIAPITCLQIRNIKVLNVGMFNVSVVDDSVNTLDCVLSPIAGISINCATRVILDNCKVLYGLGDGFVLQLVDNGTIESCQAIKNGSNGFVFDNSDTTCLKWCKANMNCLHGFCDSACNGDNFYLNCIAKQNGIHGFNIAGGGKVLQECIASQNSRDGFNLSTSLLTDGDLDITFGGDGKVITDFGGDDFGNSVAVQKDGKIVVGGNTTTGGVGTNFGLARYNADGSLDTTFGTGGLVTTDFGGTNEFFGELVLQKDGKIVAAGQASSDFVLVRYNRDGSLDMSFGTGGVVSTPGTVGVNGLALQKDGKIVAVGNTAGLPDFVVVRYNTDGSLDTSFGTGGLVVTSFGTLTDDQAEAVVIQKDGKIVVAGTSEDDFAVARYNRDGSLDIAFNPTGSIPGTVTTGGTDEGNAIALQKDGKILVAGLSGIAFAVARYNTDGSLDTSFGAGGVATAGFGGTFNSARGIALQKDGKIVVVGVVNSGGFDFSVARFNTDGSLDAVFGTGGKVTTDFGGSDISNAVALQKDGKVVVAGQSTAGDDPDFAVARYVVFKRGVVVRDCTAEENGEDGFNIAGSAYDVRDSSAIRNVVDGFLLGALTNSCQLLSNTAIRNGNVGIEDLGIDNKIFNSRANSNASSDYIGVPLVAIPTLSAIDFWANIEL